MNTYSSPHLTGVIFFDVDGVLTNLEQNKVDNDLLALVANLNQNNFLVVLNSGRSMVWLENVILSPLRKIYFQSEGLNLNKFFVIGEKGGVWQDFNRSYFTHPHSMVDESTRIPTKLVEMVKDLVDSKFSNAMFYDSTKQVMITLEKKPSASIEDFQHAQHILSIKLKEMLNELELGNIVEIDSTTIAIDIQNVILGKGYGVTKVIEYCAQHQIDINQCFTIGDSSSDFEMAETLFQMGKEVIHVHVGEVPFLQGTGYPILTTHRKYDLGTKEFFKKYESKFKLEK